MMIMFFVVVINIIFWIYMTDTLNNSLGTKFFQYDRKLILSAVISYWLLQNYGCYIIQS